jgi:hypothetical protein
MFPMRPTAALVLLIAAISLTACKGPLPKRPQIPTRDRVVASTNSIGIPYDRIVLLRYRDRLLALEVSARTELGDNIRYLWYSVDERDGFGSELVESGEGETAERPFTGRITLPGPLTLEWSRGSTGMGWLYWPKGDVDLAVYSRSFERLADIEAQRGGGRWLSRDEAPE